MSFSEKYDWYQNTLKETFAQIDKNQVEKAFEALKRCIRNRNKIFLCGNGGSASLADHFATDLSKGVATDTAVNPKVVSLCSNGPLITAIANDFGYQEIFRQQLIHLMETDDVVILISSSGNSENMFEALDLANGIGRTISITGFKSDNKLNTYSHIPIHIPCANFGIAECITSNLLHILSQSLRLEFAKPNVDTNFFTF